MSDTRRNVYTKMMKPSFVSIGTFVIGGAIFAAIIIGAVVVGESMKQGADTTLAPKDTPVVTVAATATLPAATSSASIISTSTIATTSTLSISISPSQIIEGDPVMFTITGTSDANATIANIKNVTVVAPGPNMAGRSDATSLQFLTYKNVPIAFYGTGINQATGTTTVTVTMKDGAKISGTFTIGKRFSPSEKLPVPAQLGGNSTSSQQQLVTNLAAENAALTNVYSNPNISFWTSAFTWPIHASDVSGGIIITDPFGYNRNSGVETIIHKGSDFKAPVGTPVYAINAGYVRMARLFTVYGNTVVVDHGMGIQSFYMHLSKMSVTPGEAVKQGQLLGYSGETGYSEGPHLHLTIRVGGVSIDPIKFYALFGVTP